MRGPLAYVHDLVPSIGRRQKIPEPSRALLRFSVVVRVCTSAVLGVASFRGVAGGARRHGRGSPRLHQGSARHINNKPEMPNKIYIDCYSGG